MNGASLIILAALAVAVFLALRYVYREKKKGNACIGCPYAGSCHKQDKCEGERKDISRASR